MRLSILLTGLWFVLWGINGLGWISLWPTFLFVLAIVAGVLLIADNFYTVQIPLHRNRTAA